MGPAGSLCRRGPVTAVLYNMTRMVHLSGLAATSTGTGMARGGRVSGRRAERRGRRRLVSVVSGDAGHEVLPVRANATNTVAIWPGQFTSVAAYREDVRKNLSSAVLMGLAGLLGGTAGAVVLLNTPQMTFMRLVPWLLLGRHSLLPSAGRFRAGWSA